MQFIHAADLHIDSPLRGLDNHAGAPAERLRSATRQAFVALIDLAIERQVDLLILAGDIYDGEWNDFRTGLFFHAQLARLARHAIRVFIARGNHDAQSVITRQLPAQDHVRVFSARRAETCLLDDMKVAVHGRSFPERAVQEDFVPAYPAPVPGCFNIGVLHTSLTGSADHGTYAPTSMAALVNTGYDYFALGHIHARQVVRVSSPRIVFSGNLQGRHARETGPKGCEIVTVVDGQITSSEFVPLDVVRWHQWVLDVAGVSTLDALAAQVRAALADGLGDDRDRLHAVRWLLRGESALHRLEAAQPGVLEATVHAAVAQGGEHEVWVERVLLDLRMPLDRAQAGSRSDAVGEVVRLTAGLAGDATALRAWMQAALAELPALPRDLADAQPDQLDNAALQALLADAEATVLAHLAESGDPAAGDGSP